MTPINLATSNMSENSGPSGAIAFAFPGVPGVGCLFSTAHNGNMSMTEGMDAAEKACVTANRTTLLEAAGVEAWVELRQVHQDHMAVEPQPGETSAVSLLEADGSCTSVKGLALAIKTADCQPILLTNSKGSAVAALHAGWRGNAMNFPATGLRVFCETYSIAPKDVLAVRGPSLGPGAAEFVNFEREWPKEFAPWLRPETMTMDLWSLTRHQLTEAGMRPERIFSLDLCTFSLPGHFYSYRRGHAGRQASLIWIRAKNK